MKYLNNKSYVVIEFATIDNFYDQKRKKSVNLARDEIIEVAAVKIEDGKIKEYFNSFVSIDGYNAHDIDFQNFRINSYYADAVHLIGAPSFQNIAERLFDFIGQSQIITTVFLFEKNFQIFKEKAQSFGYVFNNPTISIGDIHTAKRLKDMFEESSEKFENIGVLQLAQMLQTDKDTWTEIFADNDIFFDPDSDQDIFKGRNDPLSWALAFARLFVKLTACEQTEIDLEEQEIDKSIEKDSLEINLI